jgi:S-DNA-T family DNA segregation ATPase FtsK/SpoIIIE
VLTAQRLTAGLHGLAGLCGSRLLLGLPSRQEHVLAGGDGSQFVDRRQPGAGTWGGLRVQVAVAAASGAFVSGPAASGPALSGPAASTSGPGPVASASAAGTAPTVVDIRRPLAVVTTRVPEFVARLKRAFPELAGGVHELGSAGQGAVSAGSGPGALVGDPDAWQATWGAIAGLRATHTVLVDGCSAAEFRTVTRVRTLPPPLAGTAAVFWMLGTDGSVRRARLP